MNKITIFMLVTIVCLLVEIEAVPNEFWDNLKSGWDQFLTAIRRPVKIRRLGKLGKLKTTLNTTTTGTTSLPFIITRNGPPPPPLEPSTTTKVTKMPSPKALPPVITTELNSIVIPQEIMKRQMKIGTSSVPPKLDKKIITSSNEIRILQIPVISFPTWQSVYQWSNLQKPPNIHYKKKNARDPRVSFS